MISYHDWWPWAQPGYITMTRRQSKIQWSGGIAAHHAPKNSEFKNPLENFTPRFLGIKTASSSLIIFQIANYQCRVLLISAGAIEWHFEGTRMRKVYQGGLFLAWKCPGPPGTCNPEETGLPGLPISLSPTLFSGFGPIILPPVPWTGKNWKFATFRPRSLMLRRPGWTDKFLIFFWETCER